MFRGVSVSLKNNFLRRVVDETLFRGRRQASLVVGIRWNPSPPAPLHPVARGEDEKTCFIRVPKKRAAGVADGAFRDADGTFWGVKSTQRCFRFLWTTTPRVYEMACIQGSRELKGQGEKWMAGGIFKGNPPKECNRAHTSASRCTPSRHCRRI